MNTEWFRCYLGTPLGWVISLALAALGAYLLLYHTTHILLAVPYLFLLACPLMHLFGHGHGHHEHADRPEGKS